jgi:hypothetical protein
MQRRMQARVSRPHSSPSMVPGPSLPVHPLRPTPASLAWTETQVEAAPWGLSRRLSRPGPSHATVTGAQAPTMDLARPPARPRLAAQAQAQPTIGPRPSRPPSPGPHHDSDDDSDPRLRPAASSPACSAAAPSPALPRLPRFHEVRHEPLKGSDPPGPRAGRCRPIGQRRGRDRRLGGGHGPPRPPPTGPSSPWSNCRQHKIISASVRLRHY